MLLGSTTGRNLKAQSFQIYVIFIFESGKVDSIIQLPKNKWGAMELAPPQSPKLCSAKAKALHNLQVGLASYIFGVN